MTDICMRIVLRSGRVLKAWFSQEDIADAINISEELLEAGPAGDGLAFVGDCKGHLMRIRRQEVAAVVLDTLDA